MQIAYTDLKTYADAKNLTYREFIAELDPDGLFSYKHLLNIISGLSRASKRTRRLLDPYIKTNRTEIRRMIRISTLTTGTSVPPSPDIPPEPDDAGGSRYKTGETGCDTDPSSIEADADPNPHPFRQ